MRLSTVITFTVIFIFHLTNIFAQVSDTLWFEDWENPNWLNDWTITNGQWEVGAPSSGPGAAYLGQSCAATQLNGNYTNYADSRLVKLIPFTVPSAQVNPRL